MTLPSIIIMSDNAGYLRRQCNELIVVRINGQAVRAALNERYLDGDVRVTWMNAQYVIRRADIVQS